MSGEETRPDRPRRGRRRGLAALGALAVLGVGFAAGRIGGAASGERAHEHQEAAEAQVWTCSMHPQIRSPEPGDCPICGMDLVPAAAPGAGPELGPGQVRLGPRARALARVVTEPVALARERAQPGRLFGRVVEDEGSLRAVTSWVAGRVDELRVSTTGERVREGQIVARVYSPEVYAAHKDLRAAAAQLASIGDPYARGVVAAQLGAARQRLRLLGFGDAEIERMESDDRPRTRVPIRSTARGTVLRRLVTQGEYVERGEALLELSDLRTVWVELDAYESDLARLEVGRPIEVSVEALGGEPRSGTIAFIDPIVDPRTRVATVRVELPNPDLAIKPGMFARASIGAERGGGGGGPALTVPASAPLFAGDRSLVYVELPSEREGSVYEAREVILGPKSGGRYVVRAGLAAGDRVVTHGAFAIDADLQIRGGLSLMARADDTSREPGGPPVDLDPGDRAALAPLMLGYLDVQERLADDDLAGARERAGLWIGELGSIELGQAAAREAWAPIRSALEPAARAVAEADALDGARAAVPRLTEALGESLARFGNVLGVPVREAFCPMADGGRGARWYQRGERVDNVYFGHQMKSCGTIEATVSAGEIVVPEAGP